MEKKYLIIYHKEDNDGLFSMAIIYNYLLMELKVSINSIDLMGADYNFMETLDLNKLKDEYTNIYITDISFDTIDKMQQLYTMFGDKLTWFDHHKPMIEKSKEIHIDTITGLRDINHSALYNVFTSLYGYIGKMPDLFKVLSAWDSWSYEAEHINFEYCRKVNIGVNNRYNLEAVRIIRFVNDIIYEYTDEELKDSINNLYELGKIESDIIDRDNANTIANFGDLTWTVDGRTACALFMQKPTNSQVFTSVKDEVQNGIVFKRLTDGKWTISLYNTDNQHDFHCGEYLRDHYNGGGHEGAAGCQVSEETFINILKNKKL